MQGILKLEIDQNYSCKICGLGEVFEIISIELQRKSLLRKYGQGYLYMASNYDHSQRGHTREELEKALVQDGLKLIKSGYADAPPWKSDPNNENDKGFAYNDLIIKTAIVMFKIWIPLFERFYRKREVSHVTWAFGIPK